jgi:diguanylate cyclase
VSETTDWKKKYRDSLRESEGEEKRRRLIEQTLRRLVGRLCASGMGVDPKLDDKLLALSAANGRNADAPELEELAASLTIAVAAGSRKPAMVIASAAPLRWDSTCTAAGQVLQQLQLLGVDNAVALELHAQLTTARSDAELAAILEKTAALMQSHGEALARERLEAAVVLADVTTRLEELAGYLTESGDAVLTRIADTAAVNDHVMSEVLGLSTEVNSATELHLLQAKVSVRIDSVTKQIREFRSREEDRQLQQTGRAEHMRARISDLERQTADLGTKLDREKNSARLDALTLLANRRAFDERLAAELLSRSKNDTPVTMLMWDLDDFKIVNDSYGHRAGDQVLQRVAACFTAGLRAEDFVARIGGEEFAIFLTGLPFDKAKRIADELRVGVAALRFDFQGAPVRVTVSCGLTELRRGESGSTAFDRADGALYHAKHFGKNLCIAA